jgi:hypothetical protein
MTACAIEHGLFCGLQNSLIRARVFADDRFEDRHRNEAEDQVVVLRAAKAGRRFAYLDQIHLIYHVHSANSSASASDVGVDKQVRLIRDQIGGFDRFRERTRLTPPERRAMHRRLSRDYFWVLGYALFWQHDRRGEAIEMFRRGLRLWPWEPRYWKTYLVSLARNALS